MYFTCGILQCTKLHLDDQKKTKKKVEKELVGRSKQNVQLTKMFEAFSVYLHWFFMLWTNPLTHFERQLEMRRKRNLKE